MLRPMKIFNLEILNSLVVESMHWITYTLHALEYFMPFAATACKKLGRKISVTLILKLYFQAKFNRNNNYNDIY